MLIAHVTPAPHRGYPVIAANLGLCFQLQHDDYPGQVIACECGGDEFVHGSTPGDWFCTSCRGLVMAVADSKGEQ